MFEAMFYRRGKNYFAFETTMAILLESHQNFALLCVSNISIHLQLCTSYTRPHVWRIVILRVMTQEYISLVQGSYMPSLVWTLRD